MTTGDRGRYEPTVEGDDVMMTLESVVVATGILGTWPKSCPTVGLSKA